MRKSRFTDEQIIATLKEVESGVAPKDVCLKLGATEQNYYRWKAKLGGMEAGDARRLRDLEEEKRRLNQVVADLSLTNQALKDALEKSGPHDLSQGCNSIRPTS